MEGLSSGAYAAVLKGGLRPATIVGGTLARFFIGMASLGFLAMYTQSGYSYALAGIGICIVQASNCLIAPQISRMADRLGQSKVVPPAAIIGLGALAAVLLIVHLHGPLIAAFACSALIGFMPSVNSLTRARWSYLFRSRGSYDPARLRTAYSLEGILDDVAFMFSPAITIAFSSWFFPEAGLLLGGIAYTAGIVLVISDKKSEPDIAFRATLTTNQDAVGHVTRRPRNALLDYPIVLVFFVSMMCFGLLYGFLDLATYGFCGEIATEEIAGLCFMVASFFSIGVGFVFGMLSLKASALRQVFMLGAFVAITFLPFLFISSIPLLFFAHIMGAFSYAPFVITVNSTIERSVPSGRVTECLTWMVAGIQLGLAIAPTIAGVVIDTLGTRVAFTGVSLSGIFIPVLFLLTLPILRKALPKE